MVPWRANFGHERQHHTNSGFRALVISRTIMGALCCCDHRRLLLLLFCGIIAIYFAIPLPSLQSNNSRVRTILLYTKYWGRDDWWLGDRMGSALFESTCSVSNCRITNDRKDLGSIFNLYRSISEFDAILFHYTDMAINPTELPNQRQRRPEQRYVMFFVESPQTYRHSRNRI